MKIKRSQPSAAPTMEFARDMPGKLSNNEYGEKKGEPRGSPFFYRAVSGQNCADDR
jgi:hypothetical protein